MRNPGHAAPQRAAHVTVDAFEQLARRRQPVSLFGAATRGGVDDLRHAERGSSDAGWGLVCGYALGFAPSLAIGVRAAVFDRGPDRWSFGTAHSHNLSRRPCDVNDRVQGPPSHPGRGSG